MSWFFPILPFSQQCSTLSYLMHSMLHAFWTIPALYTWIPASDRGRGQTTLRRKELMHERVVPLSPASSIAWNRFPTSSLLHGSPSCNLGTQECEMFHGAEKISMVSLMRQQCSFFMCLKKMWEYSILYSIYKVEPGGPNPSLEAWYSPWWTSVQSVERPSPSRP